MPIPFKPALARAAVRGLRVIEGEASPAARAKALRARGMKPTELTAIDTATGAEETFRRGPRAGVAFSPEATAAQAARTEAMARHARGRIEDVSDAIRRSNEQPATRKHFEAMKEQETMSPEEFVAAGRHGDFKGVIENNRKLRASQRRLRRGSEVMDDLLLDAFEAEHGWRPRTAEEARAMLSPDELRDLGFPED